MSGAVAGREGATERRRVVGGQRALDRLVDGHLVDLDVRHRTTATTRYDESIVCLKLQNKKSESNVYLKLHNKQIVCLMGW